MRWADLDMLGHVNNVTYPDYLQEARVDMLRTHAPDARADDLAEGVLVVRARVSYLAPLRFRLGPITIESWISEIRAASFTVSYEVIDEFGADRLVVCRAATVLTPFVFDSQRPRRLTSAERDALHRFSEPAERVSAVDRTPLPRDPRGHYPLHVRFSDVDTFGHVNNVKYFEYLQESRIALVSKLAAGLAEADRTTDMVIAQADLDYRSPLLFRPEPYDVWTGVTRVGRTSFTLATEICDADVVHARARAAMVFWDSAREAAAPPSAAFREQLAALVDHHSGGGFVSHPAP